MTKRYVSFNSNGNISTCLSCFKAAHHKQLRREDKIACQYGLEDYSFETFHKREGRGIRKAQEEILEISEGSLELERFNGSKFARFSSKPGPLPGKRYVTPSISIVELERPDVEQTSGWWWLLPATSLVVGITIAFLWLHFFWGVI